MEKCGDYTPRATIGWSEKATFYSGSADGNSDSSRLLIRCSRFTDRKHVQDCLRGAAEQQNAIQSGCRRIAPILDFGIGGSGRAYRITLGYEASLADCIRAGNAFDDESLKVIVSGTLRSLAELHDKCRRAHGNLTAGNILLDEAGEVVLTDIAPRASEVSYSDDLRALGVIIYQLVRRSLIVGFLAPPLERSSEWEDSLHDSADGWREFTNRLLSAKKQDGSTAIQKALKDLKSLDALGAAVAADVPPPTGSGMSTTGAPIQGRTSKPRRKKAPKIIIAVCIVAIIGGVAWKIGNPPPPPPVPIPDKPFIGIDELKSLLPKANAQGSGEELPILTRLRNASSATEMKGWLVNEWDTPRALKQISEEWRNPPRNWNTLANELATKADLNPNEPTTPEQLADALKDIERAGIVLAGAKGVDQQWRGAAKACEQIKKLSIPGLPDFTEWAAYQVGAAPDLSAASKTAAASAVALNKFAAFASEIQPRIVPKTFTDFSKSINSYQNTPTPDTWPESWQAALGKSLRPTDQTLKEWSAEFEKIEKRIAARKLEERKSWQDKLEEVRLASTKTLESEKDDLSSRISALRRAIPDPLEDLEREFRKVIENFSVSFQQAELNAAPIPLVGEFKAALNKTLNKPEYANSKNAFLTHYFSNDLNAFYKLFDDAAKTPNELTLNFGETPTGKWEKKPAATVNATSSTWIFKSRRGTAEVTFHQLAGLDAAMAEIETSLSFARLSEVFPAPGFPPGDGPLGFRDSKPRIQDKWLWGAAETWYKEVKSKTTENPDLILPLNVDPEVCPVTWITAANAWKTAKALGGRLPTPAEWESAQRESGQRSARLRGKAMIAAEAKIEGLELSSSVTGIGLGTNAFEGYPTEPTGKDFTGTIEDNQLIWLDNVNTRNGKFNHLIGNASEWVSESEGGPHFILGGSCITPGNKTITRLPPRRAPVDPAKQYCDVTFRLVVSAIKGSESAPILALKKLAATRLPAILSKDPINP